MAIIYESANFIIKSEDHPLVDRNDGGHITINPKQKISTRQELSPKEAIELVRLTVVVGKAMEKVMKINGVDIGRINYQDNGNWSIDKPGGPTMHIHLYGRAKNAVFQPYGQSLNFPHRDVYPEFYAHLNPLTEKDVVDILVEIESLLREELYHDSKWCLHECV
jgi:diadenosine tetraphosphate (Ap4A) HIT family hydrolase